MGFRRFEFMRRWRMRHFFAGCGTLVLLAFLALMCISVIARSRRPAPLPTQSATPVSVIAPRPIPDVTAETQRVAARPVERPAGRAYAGVNLILGRHQETPCLTFNRAMKWL